MTSLVVADSTIWSNFAHAEPPSLARLAFPGLASPRQVLQEVEEGRRLGYLGTFELDLIEEVVLTDLEAARAVELERSLGRGEAACLAVGESRRVSSQISHRLHRLRTERSASAMSCSGLSPR